MKYRKLHNDELIELLFSEEDRLTTGAVNEIVRRSGELIPELSKIVMDKYLWTAPLPEWWAPVHATYILGAIGSDEVVTPLLAALKWSDAFDNEWVTEDLPSIFGSLGKSVMKDLEKIVADRSEGWSVRSIAMDALASISIRNRELEDHVVRIIAAIVDDQSEELGARRSAATILLDLRRVDCKDALLRFFAEDEKRFKDDPIFKGAISPKDVGKLIGITERETHHYMNEWMEFYNPQEIKIRQQRWAEEDALHRGRMKH